ncbi:hypothetical protein HDU76_012616 [Blyttiomyces sp. JEL0837]|nr:hypothetical protein HDU76_012616 [Blyttiomyces sp. JEL0837]
MEPGKIYTMRAAVPGMLASLLWWTSSDLVSVNPSLLEYGMETYSSIILRAGIQRTFHFKGANCPRQVFRDDQSYIQLTHLGITIVYVTAGIQTFLCVASLLVACTWYFQKKPIGPAIRAVRDPTYFMNLLADSPFGVNLVGTGNAQKHVIWQALDLVVRIGESVDTLGETVGRIKMERYRLVRNFENGRMYA